MNSKIKKVSVLTGLALACIGALSLVMVHANAGETQETASDDTSAKMVLATPNSIPEISSETGTSSAFVPSSGATASAPLTSVSKPTSTPPKPTPPAGSALTNKAKKPSYSSKPTAQKPSSKATAPKGKSYMPGFGYVDGNGGGQMTKVDGDWGGGSQIGDMS